MKNFASWPCKALLLATALCAWTPLAWAAGKDDSKGGKDTTSSPDFAQTVDQATAKFVAKDIPGAIELYQTATRLQPKNPMGLYLLGEAQFAAGNLQEAEKAWLQADQVSSTATPGVRAKILFSLARLKEAQKVDEGTTPIQQKKWEEAKTAWQAYADFAQKHPDEPLFPGSATSRIQAIDAMLKQDKAYEIVRQRIKDEKEHPPQAAAPAPTK